jgi:hypothetical protein
LPKERRAFQQMRTVRDRDLLLDAPLIVRADLVGGALGRAAKRAYDVWLDLYWRVARHLLS